MHTRQSLYEIVGNCSDKGGQQYQPQNRFILREVLARRRVMFMLRVMTYVASYKLFWNWVSVVRFQVVSHEVCSGKEFVIWHLLYCIFSQIVSLWLMGIWIRITFNTNELVNQTRHSSQMPYIQDLCFWNTMCCRQDFLVRRMYCRQDLREKMRRRQDFCDWILMDTLSCWCSM